MRRCLSLLLAACALGLVPTAHAQPAECVVLLHGLARTSGSMEPLARALVGSGFAVVNQGYPSRSAPVGQLADHAVPAALKQCPEGGLVHFVTHSMGGILVRDYLSRYPLGRLGRVVMLGPPNRGSQIVDKLRGVPGYRLLNGPAGQQLGTDSASVPMQLPPVVYPVGVIAGTRTFSPLGSLLLPGTDDGRVTVARTRVDGMADHVVLPVTHTFMMRDEEVLRQTLAFLRTGAFAHRSPDLDR
jgi:pimeloyl-ACP methyl ester carboxylesterase